MKSTAICDRTKIKTVLDLLKHFYQLNDDRFVIFSAILFLNSLGIWKFCSFQLYLRYRPKKANHKKMKPKKKSAIIYLLERFQRPYNFLLFFLANMVGNFYSFHFYEKQMRKVITCEIWQKLRHELEKKYTNKMIIDLSFTYAH